MSTITLKGQEARDALTRGVNQLADIVTVTLGPKGRNVCIDKRWSVPNIIHDGVSVAKSIHPKDPFENMGAELVKEAASKTADTAGDGTTTATLLAQAIINAGQEKIRQQANPMVLQKGIQEAVSVVVTEIKRHAKTLSNKAETASIATISAADRVTGDLIAEAFEKVGKEGIVTVEEGVTGKTEIEYKEGMQFEKGYQSSAFVTNKDRMICEIENPHILFADFSIENADEIATFLDTFIKTSTSKNIVFITDGVEGAALTTLVMNCQGHRGAIKTVAIQAPGIGNKRRDMLEDMAILTGGQAAFKENGVQIKSIPVVALGRADKIEVTESTTRIIGGKGDASALQQRVQLIKSQIKSSHSDFDKQQLHDRLARLTRGAAVIKVGGLTDVEIHDKRERAIDAVSATKAAIEEGIVAGGGVTLLKVREALVPLMIRKTPGDEAIGMKLVYDALEKPVHKLLENAGIEKGKEVPLDGKTGINVQTGEIVDMFESGIIDPAQVTRQAVENAASVASMILTTEALVTEIPEDKKSPLENMPLA